MAAIDKTYVHTYAEYEMVYDWCLGKEFTLPNGDIIKPINYLYSYLREPNVEEEWNKASSEDPNYERPIWSTPVYLDMWLYKNCPISLIQNRLKEQYSNIEKYYQEYISYKRPRAGRHFKVIKRPNFKEIIYNKDGNGRLLKSSWSFEASEPYVEGLQRFWPMNYNEHHDAWYTSDEELPWDSSCAFIKCYPDERRIGRLIRKWKLPIGSQVIIQGRFVGQEWEIIIKK